MAAAAKVLVSVLFAAAARLKTAFRMLTPSSSTSTVTADVHLAGTTVFSTKITVDASEKTSTTAATGSTLSTTTVAKGALLEFFADSVGPTIAGAGLKFYINATRA